MQPKLSNWCWAACILKIIEGLNVNSLYKKQCQIVSAYIKTFRPTEYQSGIDCCDESNQLLNMCNKALKEEHLEKTFELFGLSCSKIDNPSPKLKQYSYVKTTIEKNDAPIIIQKYKGGSTHLVLVNGYGQHNGNEYILISDPTSNSEAYWTINCKIENINIKNAWTCTVKKEFKNEHSLIKDYEFLENIEATRTKLRSLEKSEVPIHLHRFIEDPLMLFRTNPETIKTISYQNNLTHNLVSFENYNNDTAIYCESISRNRTRLYLSEIAQINEILEEPNQLIIQNENLKYITDYGVLLSLNQSNDQEFFYKLISYPLDFDILVSERNRWLNQKDIVKILEKNKPVSYFEN